MSTETTTTAPATAPVTNLRQTRKEMAAAKAAHPAGKAAPAKAKATPAAKAAKATKAAKPPVEKKLYTATARSGQAVHRMFSFTAAWAIDVADPKATKPLPKAGQIWQMYATKEQAETAAAKLVAKGYDVKIVTAKAVA
jgi:hypothetical protein